MVDNKIHVAQIIGRVAEGGVEKMVTNLYQHIDHSKVVFDFFVENTSLVVNEEEINKFGGRVIIIPSIKKFFKFNKCLKKNFKENNYDIVHSNMNTLNVFSLRIAKKCGIKIRISHSHSTSHRKEFIRHVLKQLLRPFSKVYATHYIGCSTLAGKWLFGKKAFNNGKVEIISNAINLSQFAFDEKPRLDIRKQLGIPNNSKVVGHIGRFCKQKNQEYLVNVFSELHKINSNVFLLMIGSGEDKDCIESIVKNKNLSNVIFTGPVSNPSDYYNAMDCFALTSIYEGLPVVGVEAQANRLKCFFSMNVTKECLLLDETERLPLKIEPSVWAEHINNFFKTQVLRVDGKLDDKYDINVMSNKLLKLYERYLEETK